MIPPEYAQALRDTAAWPAISRQSRIDDLYAEMRAKGLIEPGVEADKTGAAEGDIRVLLVNL